MTPPRPDYAEALRLALDGLAPIGRTESVTLAAAAGRILAEPVVADRDLPPFDRAQMDGYALRGSEVGGIDAWPVVAHIAAGMPADVAVPPGQCVAVATGAPLPADVDTVIQHELSDRGDPVRFTVDTIGTGHACHPRGADAHAGDTLMAPGTVLGPRHVGIAATAGRATLSVAARPRVIVITSGDEIRPVAATPAAHQIRNSNGPMVCGLVNRMGGVPLDHRHVPDERSVTIETVAAALDEADLLLTVGGISAGDRDHFPSAFDACSVATVFHRARIQPGGPIFIGRRSGGPVVIGLPGNPVSVLACACLFAWPVLRALGGADPTLAWLSMTLAEPVAPNPNRRAFRPAVITADGALVVPRWAGSGDLAHTASTHGLVELPIQADEVAAGSTVRFLPWP